MSGRDDRARSLVTTGYITEGAENTEKTYRLKAHWVIPRDDFFEKKEITLLYQARLKPYLRGVTLEPGLQPRQKMDLQA